MKYDFNRVHDRTNNFSAKYDELGQKFGREELIPLWVADMDFQAAEPIVEALRQRVEQGIYGYTSRSDSYFQAVCEWLERRHGWRAKRELMIHSPGVVPSLSLIIEHFTMPGDKIIIQPPVYYPFFDVVKSHERTLVENPLKVVNGRYEMDYEQLEELGKAGAKLLLLCSPHNPVGRVWTKEELVRLGEICLTYGILIISDEIHSDLVFSGHKHVPMAMISEEFRRNTITCIAPSKTFNLAGLQASIVIFPNGDDRRKFDKVLGAIDMRRNNCFSLVATEAAYRYGDGWLEEVLEYIEGNFTFIRDFCREHIPEVVPNFPEGTYLVWLDCRGMQLDRDELHDFMLDKAKIAMDDGFWFSNDYDGYMRLNAACPRSIIAKALQQWKDAWESCRERSG
ncbi:MAG: Cystathionine beta-lyase [Firmicutes bacterium]|nr:Cystathionine beta-lyase [Bacillota bacterium]